MISGQRLRYFEKFNTVGIRRPVVNSVSSEDHARASAISNKAENNGVLCPPLPMSNKIFNAEKPKLSPFC